MGCHFCQDEMMVLMAILTSVRYVPMLIRNMLSKGRHPRVLPPKKPAPKPTECCKHDHCHRQGTYR